MTDNLTNTNVNVPSKSTIPRHIVSEEKMIALFVEGKNINEVAKECGITPRTVRRRVVEPRFQALLGEARSEVLRISAERFCKGLDQCRIVLEKLRDNPESTPYVQALAAGRLIDATLKARELQLLSARVAALEQRLAEQAPP